MSDFYGGTGDDGTTGLLGKGRVDKDHPRPRAFGALDEASAALGVARAAALSEQTVEVLAQAQRDLYRIMSEVAAHAEHAERFRSVDDGDVAWLEAQLALLAGEVQPPSGFVLPGDSPSGAALDMARAIVRRAERQVVSLGREVELDNPQMLRYLNRLSSLCYALALYENQLAGAGSPSMAKQERATTQNSDSGGTASVGDSTPEAGGESTPGQSRPSSGEA